ncbi:MAG: DEAD/DEAH box helicase [Bacteroidetes bacterium]|jgi:SNF2 family DNA or RNA helicase|nr:DEAD/DEAH box helicase [Bacteroidota bacterium]
MEAAYPNLVIVVRKNRFLGWILLPYLTIKANKNFLTTEQAFSTLEVANLTESWEKSLHELALNLEMQELANRFSKKKVQAVTFFESVDSQILDEVILPFVAKQMQKILLLALENDIPIYQGISWPNLYPDQQLRYQQQAGKTLLHFTRTEEKTLYQLKVFHAGKPINLRSDTLVLSREPCLLIHRKMILHFEAEINGKLFLPFLKKDTIEIPHRAEKQYFERFIRKIANHAEIEAIGFELIDLDYTPHAQLRLEQNWNGAYGLSLSFVYGNKQIYPHQKQQRFTSLQTDDKGFIFKRLSRNKKHEQRCIDSIKNLGFKQDQSFFQLKSSLGNTQENQLHELVYYLQDIKTELDALAFTVIQQTESTYLLSRPVIQTDLQQKKDWFDLYMIVKAGEHEFPFLALRNHLLTANRIFRLQNGQIFLIPEAWFEKYRGLAIHAQPRVEQSLRIKKQHEMLIPDRKVLDPQNITPHSPDTLTPYPELKNAQLRSYQKIGFQWLNWLVDQSFGGILADDMGLGKTLQIISLLVHHYPSDTAGKRQSVPKSQATNGQLDLFSEALTDEIATEPIATQKPSLVVMPASLIHNWINEINRFAPQLKYWNYTGSERRLSAKILRQHQIILTTYGTLRNDIELLKPIAFKLVILDESQAIKNSSSKTAVAAYALPKETGIAMTGTPIENSLYDLWSQMEFANPGLLASKEQFEKHYVLPVKKHQDEAAARALQHLIMPYLLRRTKQAVAPELPPLTQIISYCEMLPEQTAYYEKEKSRLRNFLLQARNDPEQKLRLPVLVLRALMRLRQIANHPVLAEKESTAESGKFEAVTEKLQTLIAEGQKVLLFSSFTSHLKRYAAYFDSMNLAYAMLTGSTRKREEVINKFKADQKVQLFLISLKAGGFGLNLTEAGYVFMLDPWWNPAAELQALSRAHRIGQDKKVFVYRFISKDTVEEKILGLQQYKTDLADQILDTTDTSRPKIEELMRLLE